MSDGIAHPLALVRRPSPRLAEGLVTHIERRPIDHAAAIDQWEGYVAALVEHGWETVEVPPADGCPDGVFVEDAVVMYRNVAVITRPGAASRRPETASVEEVVEGLGCSINRIREPGTLDGGDVLKVGDMIYAGISGRTNAAGVRQLRAILGPLGATVVAVPVRTVLHLKSAVTALPDGSIIGHPSLVDGPSMWPRFVAMPEPSGGHVVLLGGNRLLMAASAPRSAELLSGLGYEPIPVEFSEYEKLEGCVTCLSVRIRRLR